MTIQPIARLENGSVDKKALVHQYTPFVYGIARQVKKTLSPQIQLDDLVSYGVAGLLEAAERYDSRVGANFTTFSYYRVRGAIYDGLRTMGWVSRSEYQKIRFGERAHQYLENRAIRQPTGQDSRQTQEHLDDLSQQLSQLVTIFVTSLNAMETDGFEDQHTTRQDSFVLERELKQHLKDAFLQMPKDDQFLITLYYFHDLSLEEVGKQMGLSKSWTSRRHAQAIERLSGLLKQQIDKKKQRNKPTTGARSVLAATAQLQLR